MGYLVLSRHEGGRLHLKIDPDVDPQIALRRLLEEGIEITAVGFDTQRKQLRIGIRAPREVLVLREELLAENNDDGVPCEALCR